jgi:hypothetical protein
VPTYPKKVLKTIHTINEQTKTHVPMTDLKIGISTNVPIVAIQILVEHV